MVSRTNQERHLLRRSPLSYLLYPISLLFSLILIIRRNLYKGILQSYHSPVYIISVGNIIAGGSGKTPFTIYLAELLRKNGIKLAVSHRAYQSDLENKVTLISCLNGPLPAADKAGDEAWLLAKRLSGIPVVAGKNRTEAIKLVCSEYPDTQCIILDDSFQHLKVCHDLDILIVNEKLKFGNGFVLPAGLLREPLAALQHADMIIQNRPDMETDADYGLTSKLLDTGKTVFTGGYDSDLIYDFQGQAIKPEKLTGKKVLLVSGIGNPSGFKRLAKRVGFTISASIAFPDHFDYKSEATRNKIIEQLYEKGVDYIVTTEKDYSKLRHYPEFSAKLLIIAIKFILDNNENRLLDSLNLKMQKQVLDR